MNYTDSDIMEIAKAVYGEGVSEDYDTWVMQGSSILNRLEAGKPKEFGANLGEVLNKGYYAVSNPNVPYQQATGGQFPDKDSENRWKQIYAISSGLAKGTIDRHEAQFFFTPDEVKRQKKSKSFNFKAVRDTKKVGKYSTFAY